jgi:diguanylate cyclase (GGDEF)-like protein/PAS domain S-box-containing protein
VTEKAVGESHGGDDATTTASSPDATSLWSDAELLRAVVYGSPLAIYVVGPSGLVELWNPAAERLFGWTADQAIGRRLPIVSDETSAEFDRLLALAFADQPFSDLERVRHRSDGSPVVVAISTVPLRDSKGAIRAVLGVAEDITDRRAAEEALVCQARQDSLTGLFARGYFLEVLEKQLLGDAATAALVMLDLDGFKDVNDRFGHHVGDEILTSFAQRLRSAVGERGDAGRLGGDEFVVLLRGVGENNTAEAGRALLSGIDRPIRAGGREFSIGVSAGIVHCRGSTRVEEVLRRADLALLEAKHSHPGTCRVFDQRMEDAAVERLLLETQLANAVARDEIVLHYQPIIDLATGAMTGVEALVRWEHPRLGLLPPARFVPLAESTGAIVELGLHVLRESCNQLRQWELEYPSAKQMVLSVNLSPRQMREPGLAGDVAAILVEAGVAASRLQLEVTEHMTATDEDEEALVRLGLLGVQLAIDDFGTGYSSLIALRRFPFSTLKIDRSFVAGLSSGWEDRAIIVATLSLSESLGLAVIAEGVETEVQLSMLRSLGCERAQGFLLGRPQPAEAISALLART